jgi:catechol-2,3-dioxygenase
MLSPMTGFSHVQLRVSDVQVSEQWYTLVLGLDRFAGDDDAGHVALRHRASGVVVVLSARGTPTGTDTALDHLAFAVPDGDALHAWAETLTDAGVAHDGVVLELGKPSLQLRDPDGNAIELVAPAPHR